MKTLASVQGPVSSSRQASRPACGTHRTRNDVLMPIWPRTASQESPHRGMQLLSEVAATAYRRCTSTEIVVGGAALQVSSRGSLHGGGVTLRQGPHPSASVSGRLRQACCAQC
jgi:hypothetical protein